jgi:hypothetical protein
MKTPFTHQNELMKKCLLELDDYWNNNPELAGNSVAFANLVFSNVVRHKGCYLLQNEAKKEDLNPDGEFLPDKMFPDRSGFEDSQNHFHLSGIMTAQEPSIGFLGIGLSIVELLHLKLHHDFPEEHFRITLSYPVKPLGNGDTYVRDDCRISFHAIRSGEVIFDDPENYKFEAFGIREF